MAKNIVYNPGWNLSVVCDAPAAPDSGDVCVLGSINGIALTDERADGETTVDFGPFVAELEVTDTETGGIAVGDKVYCVPATGVLNNTSTSNQLFGIALEAIASAQTATIKVMHIPAAT